MKHGLGIDDSPEYKPVRDFVKTVQPPPSCKRYVEDHVPSALPMCAPHVPWLVAEASKVAASKLELEKAGPLEPQQLFALVLYTLDVRHNGGAEEENFYKCLNDKLRERDLKTLEELQGYLYFLMSAFEKLPPEPEATFFRGVPKSALPIIEENYKSGRHVHWSGLTSVSTDRRQAENFASQEGPGGVVFHVRARTGRAIFPYSAIPIEKEVILLPNFKAHVSEGLTKAGDFFELKLTEAREDTFVF